MLTELPEAIYFKNPRDPGRFRNLIDFTVELQTLAWLKRGKQDSRFIAALRQVAADKVPRFASAGAGLTDDLLLAAIAAALRTGELCYEDVPPKPQKTQRDTATGAGASRGGGGGGGGDSSSSSSSSSSSDKGSSKDDSMLSPRALSAANKTPPTASTPATQGVMQFDPPPPEPPFQPPDQPAAMPGRETAGQTH